MKIEILLGSVRLGRESHKAAWYLREQLIQRNQKAEIIDLRTMHFPIFGELTQDELRSRHKEIAEMGVRLSSADAIVIVTPEYHGTFPGALKNALEFFGKEFRRKPIGVVATSAGRLGGVNASIQLQHVILSLGAYPMPQKLLIHEIANAFDEGGELIVPRLVQETNKFLDELIWFSSAMKDVSTLEPVSGKIQGLA